ncbi:MAG TPA: ATP-binding protein [Terracidiphilus sp.]|nr:ATP-binding protein [Terracidiphilus sp.]
MTSLDYDGSPGGLFAMKLHEVILRNFRPYAQETRISIDDFTAIIGKNDVGKSCVLEALEVFFNESLVKIDSDDSTKGTNETNVWIGCSFSDPPQLVVIDEDATTTLADEYLLNENGHLEIIRIFDCAARRIAGSTYARALHPSAEGFADLLSLRNTDLKKRFDALKIEDKEVNKAVNNSLRKAIWRSSKDLRLELQLIPLDKEDAKKLWTSIETDLPLFALFQADRPSRDEDAEVQDPMKSAIIEALAGQRSLLEQLKEAVRNQTVDVARRTLEKLREWDASLANELSPNFKAEPKWDQIFKITLTSDEQIPINKRGSGVRRLVLLSFFRAEAERRREGHPGRPLIYAIEEPETSQHPNFQRMLVEAFQELAQTNCQVIITTHNPALARFAPPSSIRFIDRSTGATLVHQGGEDILDAVAATLGVLPDSRVAVLVFVEGPTDVEFLRHASKQYHQVHPEVPDLSDTKEVAFLPLGGTNLQQWVDKKYLKGLGRPEVHLYDMGSQRPPRYEEAVRRLQVAGVRAYLTVKREIENYYHRDAIQEAYGIAIPVIADTDSVAEVVARLVHESAATGRAWGDLEEKTQQSKMSHVKQRLVRDALPRMDYNRLAQADPDGLIPQVLRDIDTSRIDYLNN